MSLYVSVPCLTFEQQSNGNSCFFFFCAKAFNSHHKVISPRIRPQTQQVESDAKQRLIWSLASRIQSLQRVAPGPLWHFHKSSLRKLKKTMVLSIGPPKVSKSTGSKCFEKAWVLYIGPPTMSKKHATHCCPTNHAYLDRKFWRFCISYLKVARLLASFQGWPSKAVTNIASYIALRSQLPTWTLHPWK